MNNLKIMFRSPRFLSGFLLVFLVILYAVAFPMVNRDDPKASRKTNPLYEEMAGLRDALSAETPDDAQIAEEMAKLSSHASPEIQETLTGIQKALDAGGMTKALSGAKQVKKSNPLYDEFATLRTALESADQTGAEAELAVLDMHQKAVMAGIEGVSAAVEKQDAAGALAATETIQDTAVQAEFQPVKDLLKTAASDLTAVKEALATLAENHEKTYKWVVEIGVRLASGGYAEALKAASEVQKDFLIPKDTAPNREFVLGTDNFSRDVLLEMAYGARTSLQVGLLAGIIATFIGMVLGLTAGFVGGKLDNFISAFTNTFIVIPSFIVLILISIALGQIKEASVTGLIIGLTSWPWTARAVRAQTTSLRNRDHVNMARITGYSTPRIIVTEILPYIASYVVMAFILQVASGIMSEATLAILGLGDPTAISLGRMINWAMQYEAVRSGRWWQFVPVAGTIAAITFGLYMMNSGMDEVFNPKIRS